VIGRVLRVVLPLVVVLLVGAGVWLAFTGSRAVAAVDDLQQSVNDVQAALDDTDLAALRTAAGEAQSAARRANDAVDGPVWGLVAAIPYLGDTPEVARTTASALATAADGVTPLLEVADVLDPASLYSDGRIAVDKLRASAEPLVLAAADLDSAAAQIATAPVAADGAWVPATLDDQRAEAAAQLTEAAAALDTAAAAADVVPALLGADGPRTWFIGLQTPAEARGTGGLVGNIVTIRADDGRLTLGRTGSNTDFRTLGALPDLGDDFVARYGQNPRRFTNSNLSPDFPSAALLWQRFYADTFDREADVVAGLDVAALGALARASGPITLLDSTVLQPDEVVPFFLSEVYEAYPNREERKRVQEAVAESVFDALTSGDFEPAALVREFAALADEGRLLLWSPDAAEQGALDALHLTGALASQAPREVYPVVINASGTKLDTYLDRDIVYTVGRCTVEGRVASEVQLTLTADLPDPLVVDPFVLGLSTGRPNAPVQATQVQLHAAAGATVAQVNVDGRPVSSFVFTEQGRGSAVVEIALPAREPVTLTFILDEPADDAPGQVQLQPLAREAAVTIRDETC